MEMNSVKAFLSGIIDYAGIFPPASLPLKESFGNYLDYRTFKYNWMIDKFVCPFSRLNELGELINSTPKTTGPLNLSVLGALSNDTIQFEKNISKDIHDMVKFLNQNKNLVSIGAYEVKLPKELLNFRESGDLLDTLNIIQKDITKHISKDTQIFYELDLNIKDWIDAVDALTAALSVCNQFYIDDNKSPKIGFKLRTGGVVSDVIPTPMQVAYVISKCYDNKVPFKATAGLHHPVKHFNETINPKLYGFFNIFGAGIIQNYYELEVKDLIEIIENEDASKFIFTDDSFSYRDYTVSTDEIKFVRDNYMISFGSCSFDEPVRDLRQLKLL